MIRIVDGTDTHIVQKVSHTDKRNVTHSHFQTVARDKIGKERPEVHDTLELARIAIGKILVAPTIETAPKSAYADQQTGYSRK